MGFQLPWTRLVCRPHGPAASTFALFTVASVGMQRECQPWISLIPPSVGLNSLPLIQCLFSMCCARGIFFFWHHVWPPVISQQMLAGTAQLAEQSSTVCHKLLSASMLKWTANSRVQKIKSIRKKKHATIAPLYSSFDCCFPLHVNSSDQDSGKSQEKVITEFQLYFYISSTLLKITQTSIKQMFLNCSQAT